MKKTRLQFSKFQNASKLTAQALTTSSSILGSAQLFALICVIMVFLMTAGASRAQATLQATGTNTCETLFERQDPTLPVFQNRVIIHVFNSGRNVLMKANIFDRFTQFGANGPEARLIVHTDYGSEKDVSADLAYNVIERVWVRADLRPGDGRGGILKKQAAILVAARTREFSGVGFVGKKTEYIAEGSDGRLYFVDGTPESL